MFSPLGLRRPWLASSGYVAPLDPPGVPADLVATPGDQSVTLTWSAAARATSHALYWSTTAGVTTASTRVAGVAIPYAHTGRTNGTAYYYRVAGVNGAGEGELSAEVAATPAAPLANATTDWLT